MTVRDRLGRWRSALEMPVLTRELRGRMRGSRAFMVMFVYTAALSAVTVGFLAIMGARSMQMAGGSMFGPGPPMGHGGYSQPLSLGRELFLVLAVAQFELVAAITPALTCGTLTSEWERRTLEMLAVTTMSTGSIILGKLLAALCYVGLLLLCAAPIFALAMMLGGVSPLEIIFVDLLAIGAALLLGAIGLLASALVRRTYTATALAYGAVAVIISGLLGALSSAYGLIPAAGVILSGILTGFARWGIPRWRPGWRPQRVHYIGIFGFCLALVAAVMNTGLVEDADQFLSTVVHTADPMQLLQLLAGGSGVATALLGALTFLGAGAAVLGAVSLFRVVRAPEPDSLETQTRVERERRSPVIREAT